MRYPRHRLVGLCLSLGIALGACSAQPSPSGLANESPAQTDLQTPNATATQTLPPETSPDETPIASGLQTLYTVVAGDTMASIARRFATSVQQLQAWNQARYPSLGSDPGTLLVGWELVVVGDPGITPLPAPLSQKPVPRNRVFMVTYCLGSGETLPKSQQQAVPECVPSASS